MTPTRSHAGWWVVGVAAMVLLGWVLRPSPAPEVERAAVPSPPPAPAAPIAAPAPAELAQPATSPKPSTPPSSPPAATGGDAMERLRAIVDTDPAAALALAREDAERFPNSPVADERSFRTMQALVHLGEIAPARDEATTFFTRHPGSSWGERVERLTGVHSPRYFQNPR